MMSEHLPEDADAYEQAQYELRRVDHLIYVSLKYTRTVDVIRNIIARLISTFDFIWDEFLRRAEKERKIYELPTAPGAKLNLIRKIYADDDILLDTVDFYILMRQFNNAQYTSEREFRRHVTMKAVFPTGETHEITIDSITEYYKQAKRHLEKIGETYFR
ncbi:MAG: hypothetical protein ACMXYF_02365 [Candidatus Woesearchaeota archaeon]